MDAQNLVEALDLFLQGLGRSPMALNLLVADDTTLRTLNARFRGQDRPTDILSWSYEEDEAPSEPDSPPLLGELAVSLERTRSQAARNGWPLDTELLRLLAHGCAHLAGYDHQNEREEREMLAVEIGLLARVGLHDIYPEGASAREPALSND